MNYRYYKAASERTDEDERALIPPFRKTISPDSGLGACTENPAKAEGDSNPTLSRLGVGGRPFDEKAEHEHDLEEESKRDYYEVDNDEQTESETQN